MCCRSWVPGGAGLLHNLQDAGEAKVGQILSHPQLIKKCVDIEMLNQEREREKKGHFEKPLESLFSHLFSMQKDCFPYLKDL